MNDKKIIVLGTIMVITFNVLTVIFSVLALKKLPIVGGLCITIPLCFTSLWADFSIAKYFITKFKKK